MNRLFGKMTIRQKLQLGFGALILLVMSLAGITVRNNLAVRQDYQLLADDSFTAVRSLAQAELKAARTVETTSAAVHIVLQAYRNAIEAGGGATDTTTLIAHLEPGALDAVKAEIKDQQDGLLQYLKEFSAAIDKFHRAAASADDKAALAERDSIVAKGKAIVDASAATVALIDAHADLESILAGNEKMEEVDTAFFSTVDDKIADRTAQLGERRDSTEALINKSTETLLGFAALAILVGLGVGLFIADQIATPVSKLRDAVMKFGAGDFGAAEALADVKSTDEVGDLVVAFRKMAADLDAANTKLARNQRLSMLGQVAGTVSHELRNPLGAIRASLAVFRKLCADKGLGIERSLERAERSVGRCDGIIGDLLEYTRARDMTREPIAIRRLDRRGAGRALPAAGRHAAARADVRLHGRDRRRPLPADPHQPHRQRGAGDDRRRLDAARRSRTRRHRADRGGGAALPAIGDRHRPRHSGGGAAADLRAAVHHQELRRRPRPADGAEDRRATWRHHRRRAHRPGRYGIRGVDPAPAGRPGDTGSLSRAPRRLTAKYRRIL